MFLIFGVDLLGTEAILVEVDQRREERPGAGCRVSSFGVYGLWFMVWGLGFGVYGLWFMVYGLWFMVYGLWLMVDG